MSAMSLVQLILKKWGDDAAGAAKDLERLGGFPEPVARRIATGELPMDAASVEARRIAQGYGDELYHGSTHDITEFNGKGNPSNDWGQGTYLTDSTYDASTNYAGEGPDLTIRLEETAEQIKDEIRSQVRYSEDLTETLLDIQDEYGLDAHDMAKVRGWADDSGAISYRGGVYMPDHPRFMLNDESENMLASALTSAIARKQLKGGNDGVIYPVRVKQEGLLDVKDRVELPDYEAQAADELGYDPSKMDEYDEEALYEIEERAWEIQAEDYDSPNSAMFGVGNEIGADMSGVSSIGDGDTWNDVRNILGEASTETDEGDFIGAGGVLSQVMDRAGATGVVDGHAPSRFPTMGAGEHTVMFPGSENQIRSVNAAFDPQYTGSNIMGGAAGTAGLAGLLAAGQSDDSDASVASLAARGLKLVGNEYDPAVGGTVWNILDEKGTKLGGADMGVMDGGNYSAYEMHLNPEHRGTGLMSEAYDAIEEVSGRKIEPSDTLTEDGMKFWMRRDPQKMRGMADKGLLFPWEGDVLETIFAEALEAKK